MKSPLPADSCVFIWVHTDGTKSHFHPMHLDGYVEVEWTQAWFVTDDGGLIAEGPFESLLEATKALVGGLDTEGDAA
jgi:hypothetical protein